MSTAIRTAAKVQSLRPAELKPAPPPISAPGGAAYLARAVALHLAGQRDEALKHLQRAIAEGYATPEIHRAMGHIQFELGNFDQAARSYRSLVQMKPQYAMGWFNLAVCLERLSSWDDAAEAFHKACTLDPKHIDAHLGLAICHLRTGRSEIGPVLLRALPGTGARSRGRPVR